MSPAAEAAPARPGSVGASRGAPMLAATWVAAWALAMGGQAWIRSAPPEGLPLPERPEAPPVAVLEPTRLAQLPEVEAWSELAVVLGPDAVERALAGEGAPTWRLALGTADPAFREAVAAAGRQVPAVQGSPDADAWDLPGLEAFSRNGAVGWRAPVGELPPGDPDALAALLRALGEPDAASAGTLIAANLLPGEQLHGEPVRADVYRMDGWSRGPRIGVEYSFATLDAAGVVRELRFEATEEGGALHRR